MADDGDKPGEKRQSGDAIITQEEATEDLGEEQDYGVGEEGAENLEDKGIHLGEGGETIKKTTDRSKLSDKIEDFHVRVKILEGRQLAGSNIKPLVKVKCGPNQTKITRPKKGSAPMWDEMMVFQFKESLKNLYDYIIEFTVNNSRTLRFDSLIGYFKLDLGNVYDQQGHAYVRKWILLTDPEDSSNTPMGYLKVTMYILGAGDEPPSDSPNPDEEDVEGNLLTPAGATLKSVVFTLRVFKAEDLPQMDSAKFKAMKRFLGKRKKSSEEAGKSLVDPFVVFKFAGKKRKTKVIKQNNKPEWYEELSLPLKFPSMCETLQLTLYDWDRAGGNDVIGTIKIPISKISSTGEDSDSGFLPTFGPTFVNIYGSKREFSDLEDELEPMNTGKCEGCAYRGRMMIELQTKAEEEEKEEKLPISKPIEEDLISASKKFTRRKKYQLIVAFQEASMIEKISDPVEFEVSLGNYGNKFDKETRASSSTTEPTQAVFEGTNYYYIPWGSKKPVVCVTSHWEDVGFRYHGLNFLLRMISTLEKDIARVKRMVEDNYDEIEIAYRIVQILDDLLLGCAEGVPEPRGKTATNQLDTRIYRQRLHQLAVLKVEATELRQTCSDAKAALIALEDYLERLQEISYEPQNSMPDIVIWMNSGNKRIAYTRIPANEVFYAKSNEQYCGRMCGRMQNIFLKYPTANAKSKKNYKIGCQLQAMLWLGRASDQDVFDFDSRGKMSVYADTYETEIKLPVKGWLADGYKDRTSAVSLAKAKFVCPPGWQWDDDWFVSASDNFLHDESAGFDLNTEEAYEVQYRFPGGLWEEEGFLNSRFDQIPSLNVIEIQEGWAWQDEWSVDCNRAVDEDGWQYTIAMDKKHVVWQAMEKVFHSYRRRRWVRTKNCVDVRVHAKKERAIMTLEEGWEYSKSGRKYRPQPKTLDTIRRRRWMRRMIAEESRGSAAIFSLDRPLVSPEHVSDTVLMPSSDDEIHPGPGASLDGKSDRSQKADEEGTVTSGEKKESRKKGQGRKDSSKFAKVKKKKTVKMPTPKIFLNFEGAIELQLRVYLYQARALLPMDKDSFSDPFVYVTFMNQCKRSEVIRRNLNPIWDQTLIIDMDYFGDLRHLRSSCPDVILEIFDKDDIGSLDFMGRATLQPMFKIDPEEPGSPRLAWYEVMKGNIPGGSILAAAELFVKSDDKMLPSFPHRHLEEFKVPFGIRPVLRRTALEFVIWGVRNMEPYQLLSVDKPSVVIEIGDVEVRSEIIKSMKKCPNFSKAVFFVEANLPIEQIYCPPIVIRVKDHRKFGHHPTVGQHIISDPSMHAVPPLPALKHQQSEEDEGIDGIDTVIEVIPPSRRSYDMNRASGSQDDTLQDLEQPEFGESRQTPEQEVDRSGQQDDVQDVEIVISDLDDAAEENDMNSEERGEDDEDDDEKREGSEKGLLTKLENLGKKIIDTLPISLFEEELREDEIDWWSKYFASIGESDKCGQYMKAGLDTIKVYDRELENQQPYNNFSDFIQTYPLFSGEQGKDDDDQPPIVGEFKGAILMYPLPDNPNDPMPEKIFKNVLSTDPVEVKVRIYVVRAFDLAPKDPNGLSDPYLKIKAGKQRIVDKSNYLPNTLNPIFGRTFELDLLLPMEKDLRVEVFDYDLIGTDDKIGETIIDLENRYYSKYRAWCGLPNSYCSQGPNKWRDQKTPKEWLLEKAREMKADVPMWNGNTCVLFNKKTYALESFERNKIPCKDWGAADERLALHILRTLPHVTEHVETRPLFIDDIPGIEQGRVQLWVDMFPKEFGEPPDPVDITPRIASEHFLRVIVWNCREIPMMDTSLFGEKMTDIYVKGWIGGLEHKKKKTDVHYRSLDGTGMFNWRFVIPFDYLPQERVVVVSKKRHLWSLDATTTKVPPVLYIQVWDNDLFGPNEYISEIDIPLNKTPKCTKFQRFATLKNIPDLHGNCAVPLVNMFDQKMLSGWWPLYTVKDGEKIQAGKIEMTIEVVSKDDHEERPAADARDEPNENPKLEKPKRPATSFAWFLSPWKSIRYIIWRKYKWIIITILLILALILIIILFIYAFPGNFSRWLLQTF